MSVQFAVICVVLSTVRLRPVAAAGFALATSKLAEVAVTPVVVASSIVTSTVYVPAATEVKLTVQVPAVPVGVCVSTVVAPDFRTAENVGDAAIDE